MRYKYTFYVEKKQNKKKTKIQTDNNKKKANKQNYFYLLVSAIECFICSSTKGNCVSKHTDCEDEHQACQKKTSKPDHVEKSCSTYQQCLAEQKLCSINNTCAVYCCIDSYCNDSTPTASLSTWLTLTLSGFSWWLGYFIGY